MRIFIVVCLILFIGPLSMSAQTDAPNTSKSIVLIKNNGNKIAGIPALKRIKVKTNAYGGTSINGKFNIISEESIEINGIGIPINDISRISLPSSTAKTIGIICMVVGGISLIGYAAGCNSTEFLGCLGHEYLLPFGLVTAGVGVGLNFIPKQYDLQNNWSISIK